MVKGNNLIYCIGDSHVSFFSGTDRIQPLWPEVSNDTLSQFKTFRIGPVLAYNLCENNTKTKGREKLFDVIRTEVPHKSKVLLCFGEIDCRAHLLKQAQAQGRDINDIVCECVGRYFSCIKEILALGHELLIWNVIPSTRYEKITNEEYPVYGTCAERNQVTKLFNEYTERLCEQTGCKFISIYEQLLGSDGLTQMEYFKDPIHLSQKVMPWVLKKIQDHAVLGDQESV